uniref:Uncharacterized protein n=1 Tax=Rhizophora mucronata TaxID=61149 RepID=A0A2P2JKS1_RHIMU
MMMVPMLVFTFLLLFFWIWDCCCLLQLACAVEFKSYKKEFRHFPLG